MRRILRPSSFYLLLQLLSFPRPCTRTKRKTLTCFDSFLSRVSRAKNDAIRCCFAAFSLRSAGFIVLFAPMPAFKCLIPVELGLEQRRIPRIYGRAQYNISVSFIWKLNVMEMAIKGPRSPFHLLSCAASAPRRYFAINKLPL